MVKTNKSPNLPQREKAMTTAEGQKAASDGFLRPLLTQPLYESNLSSLKDNAGTVDTSQYLRNKNYWKMQMVYIKKSLLKNENKASLRKYMWTHQLLDIKEKAKVTQGWNKASGTQRFENYVQVMIY